MSIVKILFGSHLYGTSTEKSDFDYKLVVLPDVRDFILGRVKDVTSTQRPKSEGEKNLAGEEEYETFTLQKYLHLMAEGQTIAYDMLFAPVSNQLETSDIWKEIYANRHKLVSKKSEAFVGYCRQQANKYGIKGSRVAAVRVALNLLDLALAFYPSHSKLGMLNDEIEDLVAKTEHMSIVPIEQASGEAILHWEVCGRKFSYSASIQNARGIIKDIFDAYGARALLAEQQQGVDWKALSHAVRVANQAIELFTTGEIVFPLKNASHILDIKLGKIPYQEIAKEIEDLFVAVEDASAKSSLREEPDRVWIDEFVYQVYMEHVFNHGLRDSFANTWRDML